MNSKFDSPFELIWLLAKLLLACEQRVIVVVVVKVKVVASEHAICALWFQFKQKNTWKLYFPINSSPSALFIFNLKKKK